MKFKKIRNLVANTLIISTLLQLVPIEVNAATISSPTLSVYQKDNKAKIELGVDIADSDVLWKTGMETSDQLPNLNQGGNGAGNQSFTTSDKSSGSRSLMVTDTITNSSGNYFWPPKTSDTFSGWNSSTIKLPDNSKLALVLKVKAVGGSNNKLNLYMNTTWDHTGQSLNNSGKWSTDNGSIIKFKNAVDFRNGAPDTIEVYSNAGTINMQENNEYYNIVTSTNSGYQWGQTQYKWSNTQQKFIKVSNIYKPSPSGSAIVNQKFNANEPVLFARDRNVGFESRTVTPDTGWNIISSSATLTDPYYSFSQTGVDLRCTWSTDSKLFADDVKVGYASQVEVFRNGTSLGKNYNYDILDSGATDKARPNNPTNIKANNNNDIISWSSSVDNGTTYSYTAKRYDSNGNASTLSGAKNVVITSGIAGYAIVADKNSTTIPSNKVTTTNTTYSVNGISGDYYVHIEAIDKAGNMSDVQHIFVEKSKPSLTLTPNPSQNNIRLNWSAPTAIQNYTYMLYSKADGESEFQTIPAKNNIKVLNVYPNVGNNLKTWMETNGYGKGLISVDEVSIDNFNNNPSGYLGTKGNWKYDVVMFGSWDGNNLKDYTVDSSLLIRDFINSGGGYLSGHDSIGSYFPRGTANNSSNLRDLMAIKYGVLGSRPSDLYNWYMSQPHPIQGYYNTDDSNWYNSTDYNVTIPWFIGGTDIVVKKKGLLTNYPWVIEEKLNIPYSHVSAQYSYGDVWMQFDKYGNV